MYYIWQQWQHQVFVWSCWICPLNRQEYVFIFGPECLLLIGSRKQKHQSRSCLNVVYYQWNIPNSPTPRANDTNTTHSCGFLEQAYLTRSNSLPEPEPKSVNTYSPCSQISPRKLILRGMSFIAELNLGDRGCMARSLACTRKVTHPKRYLH